MTRGAGSPIDEVEDADDWFLYAEDDPPLPSAPRPTSAEVAQLLGQAGNLYSRRGRCPPFHLQRYIEYLLDAGVGPEFIYGQVVAHLPVESRLVRRRWGALHRAKGDQRRLWKRAAPDPVEPAGVRDGASPSDDVEPSTKPAGAAPTKPSNRADRLIQDMLGHGRRVTAVEFLAEARRRKIAPRTFARARKRNQVVTRRVGFGAGAVFWLSLPATKDHS